VPQVRCLKNVFRNGPFDFAGRQYMNLALAFWITYNPTSASGTELPVRLALGLSCVRSSLG